MKKKKFIFLILVLLLLIVTIGTTYSLLRHAQAGKTFNTLEVGSITFLYEETSNKGRGITILNAMPVPSNNDTKSSNDYFEFKIKSKSSVIDIPYVVTARLTNDSDEIMGEIVDVYLTEVDGGETPTDLFKNGAILKYSRLTQYEESNFNEKILFTDKVIANNRDYEKTFRFRMWIDENADLSGITVNKYYCGEEEVERGNICSDGKSPSTKHVMESPYNNKEFSVRINDLFMARVIR